MNTTNEIKTESERGPGGARQDLSIPASSVLFDCATLIFSLAAPVVYIIMSEVRGWQPLDTKLIFAIAGWLWINIHILGALTEFLTGGKLALLPQPAQVELPDGLFLHRESAFKIEPDKRRGCLAAFIILAIAVNILIGTLFWVYSEFPALWRVMVSVATTAYFATILLFLVKWVQQKLRTSAGESSEEGQ